MAWRIFGTCVPYASRLFFFSVILLLHAWRFGEGRPVTAKGEIKEGGKKCAGLPSSCVCARGNIV